MKICIIGASKGLGEALVRESIRAGHTVYGSARSQEQLLQIERHCGSDHFLWSAADITSPTSVQCLVADMTKHQFVPDLLILTAGIQSDDLTDDGYDHTSGQPVIDVNLSGTLQCIEAFLPAMLRRKKGRIVVVSSTAALRPSVRSAAYSASKAGIAMAMRSLRLAYGDRGVDFKTIMLGPVATTMWEGKKSWLVPSPEKTASAILRFAQSSGATLFYPFLTTTLLRLSMCVPDRLFKKVSGKLMK